MKTVKRETITNEMIEKALACETPADLVKMAKDAGYEMTEAEADAYLTELADFKLDSEQLKKVAGGLYSSNESKLLQCNQVCESDCYFCYYDYYW